MFINEIFENSDDMFAMPWRAKVASLLIKLLESPARQRSVEIEQEDIDDIKLLIDALQKNDINKAKALWDRFSYNELDNALYLYIHRLRPEIDLFKLLGDEDDYLDESDDMFAERWYSDDQIKRMIINHFQKNGQSHLAHDMAQSWINVTEDPHADSTLEILTANNEWLQDQGLPFKFTHCKWDEDSGDMFWHVTGAIPSIRESDDMFASPFRVERDVMMWQRDAARIAGVRGMHSKKLGNDIVFWVQEKGGPVNGVYYSPQPASDETNIGTWNKRFRGDLEQYMAQDPNNPFKDLREEDDMFSTAPSMLQKLSNALIGFGEGYFEHAEDFPNNEEHRHYREDLILRGQALVAAGKAFKKGMHTGIMEWLSISPEDRMSFTEFTSDIEGWNPEEYIQKYMGVNEDAAGVGVVKNSKDPRYVMATMGDQNDVTAETLPKMMKAYSLIGKKAKK